MKSMVADDGRAPLSMGMPEPGSDLTVRPCADPSLYRWREAKADLVRA
jgi:hypothetical protein